MRAASAVSFIASDFHVSASMMIIASHNSGQYTEHRPYGFDSCMITARSSGKYCIQDWSFGFL